MRGTISKYYMISQLAEYDTKLLRQIQKEKGRRDRPALLRGHRASEGAHKDRVP